MYKIHSFILATTLCCFLEKDVSLDVTVTQDPEKKSMEKIK